MTTFMQQEVLTETQELRGRLLAVLTDADLGFRPADGCLTLGELCREVGEVQHAYIDSFRTFRNDFGYRHDPAVSGSVERLTAWYEQLGRRSRPQRGPRRRVHAAGDDAVSHLPRSAADLLRQGARLSEGARQAGDRPLAMVDRRPRRLRAGRRVGVQLRGRRYSARSQGKVKVGRSA